MLIGFGRECLSADTNNHNITCYALSISYKRPYHKLKKKKKRHLPLSLEIGSGYEIEPSASTSICVVPYFQRNKHFSFNKINNAKKNLPGMISVEDICNRQHLNAANGD